MSEITNDGGKTYFRWFFCLLHVLLDIICRKLITSAAAHHSRVVDMFLLDFIGTVMSSIFIYKAAERDIISWLFSHKYWPTYNHLWLVYAQLKLQGYKMTYGLTVTKTKALFRLGLFPASLVPPENFPFPLFHTFCCAQLQTRSRYMNRKTYEPVFIGGRGAAASLYSAGRL